MTVKLPSGQLLRMRLLPLIHTKKGSVWLVSLAVAKSNRQINDWFNKRPNQRTRKLSSKLTGKLASKIQAIAIRQLRLWAKEHPVCHSISFRCESALPEKQFKVWQDWFQKHESSDWEVIPEHRAFAFYKSPV